MKQKIVARRPSNGRREKVGGVSSSTRPPFFFLQVGAGMLRARHRPAPELQREVHARARRGSACQQRGVYAEGGKPAA